MPKNIEIPVLPKLKSSKYNSNLSKIIHTKFEDHPGNIENVWFPTNRSDSLKWLRNFLKERFKSFGDYEDAIDSEHNFIFHSALSPLLNIGLLTPAEIISETIKYSEKNNIPLNSLEGFIRQIIGWREFIRGTYHLKGDEERQSNFLIIMANSTNHGIWVILEYRHLMMQLKIVLTMDTLIIYLD